jgi:hypothetical protein
MDPTAQEVAERAPEQVRTWIRTLGGRETLYVERVYR